jgi:hypothetical protein
MAREQLGGTATRPVDLATKAYVDGLVASGGVVGPGSSTNNDLAAWSGTGGALLKDSGVATDGAGNISAANLSGTNTGDQDLSGLVTKTTTVNGHALSANVTVTKSDVSLGNVDNTSDATKNAATVALTNKDLTSGTNSFPTLNQSTTGSAATLTTSRNIDGQAFNGSADITVIAPGTHAATSKTTPVDADELPIVDSAASNVLKKLTWANLKATVKSYYDSVTSTLTNKDLTSGTNTFPTLNQNTTGTAAGLTGKTTPTGALVGTTDTQALTNKDLSGAGNSFPTLNQNTTGTAAGITGKTTPTGALVGTTDTQTLTNKDLTSGTNSFPTLNQSTSGNAATATALATARAINGVNFDGTAAITNRLDQLSAPTAAVSMGSQNLTNLADPSGAQDGATKSYVDASVQGLQVKPTATVVATSALAAGTYSNGTSGVGATFTVTATGTTTVDGHVLAAGELVLLTAQASAFQNGLYTVTTAGTTGVSTVLTRHVDMNTATKFAGAFVPVGNTGTTNPNSLWLANPSGTVTVGTTAIPFNELNRATDLSQGTGITISGNQVSVDNTVVVTLSGTQALINKDLTGSGNTFPTLNQNTTGTAAGLTGKTTPTGALVGTTDTQALTNKDLTGAGNAFPTLNQSTTGNAATATKLATARNIGGVAFDGSAAIVPGTATPTASQTVTWDANSNLSANAFIPSYTSTATAAGITTLTIASTQFQVFTGATTQTVKLPTTSVAAGGQYLVINASTGAVTVQSSGANTIVVLAAGTAGLFISTKATPTAAADWTYRYYGTAVASGKALSVNNSLTLAGTDATTMTFPGSSDTVVTLAASQALTNKDLTGAGNTFPTLNQSTTGNAATATTLATSRNIDGQAFNGSADITVIAPGTHAATSKTTPVDADELSLVDSAASNVLKKLTWVNLKAGIKSYYDSVTSTLTNKTLSSPVITGYTETVQALGTLGSTTTLPTVANGTMLWGTLTTATACTVTMPTAAAGFSFYLALRQPASGTATTATFTGVKWPAAGAPTITATVGKADLLSFSCYDGTNWYGAYIQGYTY